MVRWGLGICAACLAIMLLIPVRMAPGPSFSASPAADRAAAGVPARVGGPARAAMAGVKDAHAEAPVPPPQMAAALYAPPLPARLAAAAGDTPPPGLVERPLGFYRAEATSTAVRAGPGPREREVATLSRGQTVEALSRFGDDWLLVRTADGRAEGYVRKTLLVPTK